MHHAYQLSAQEDFRKRVSEVRAEITSAAVGRLTEAATKAANKLIDLLESENESISLNAAKAILANVGPISELGELRARLDAIEAQRTGKGTTKAA